MQRRASWVDRKQEEWMKLLIASLAALVIAAPVAAQDTATKSTTTTEAPKTTTTHKTVRHHKPVRHRRHKIVHHKKHVTHVKASIKTSSSTSQ